MGLARKADDFIIDQVLQPGVDRAEWWLGLRMFTLARICTGAGALAGLIWIKLFDRAYSTDFFEDMLCLSIMAGAAYVQINTQQARGARRANMAPAVRLTGLLWRTLWLVDLAAFPFQLPVEGRAQLALNFAWTLLVVLPYWIICCRRPPPPVERRAMVFAPVPITLR